MERKEPDLQEEDEELFYHFPFPSSNPPGDDQSRSSLSRVTVSRPSAYSAPAAPSSQPSASTVFSSTSELSKSISLGLAAGEPTEPDRFLGKGEYGTVVSLRSVRTKHSIGQIMKVSLFRNKRDIRTFHREVHFLMVLQPYCWSRERLASVETKRDMGLLVPRLYSWWTDGIRRIQRRPMPEVPGSAKVLMSPASAPVPHEQGIQLMEQMEETVTHLGRKQAKPFKVGHAVVYTTGQIATIVALVHTLDRVDVVHGDLKRRNLLYRGADIRVCDFGFAGYMSVVRRFLNVDKRKIPEKYAHPKIGYPREMGKWANQFPSHLWQYLNRWQMYFDIVYNRETYVLNEAQLGSPCVSRLPEALIRRLLNVPLSIVYEFDGMIREELLRNPDRKHVPDLPPLPLIRGPSNNPGKRTKGHRNSTQSTQAKATTGTTRKSSRLVNPITVTTRKSSQWVNPITVTTQKSGHNTNQVKRFSMFRK